MVNEMEHGFWYGAWYDGDTLFITEPFDDWDDAYDKYADNPMEFTPDQFRAMKWRGVMNKGQIEEAMKNDA